MKKITTVMIAILMIFAMAMPTMANTVEATPEEMGLVPVRVFFEEIGGLVAWRNDDRSIHIAIDGGTIVLYADQTVAYANGNPFELQDGVSIWQDISFLTEDDLITVLLTFIETLLGEINITTVHLTEEAREIALYDFDYVVSHILDNSPWDSVIYRSLGLDFEEHVARNRYIIENMLPLNTVIIEGITPVAYGDDARAVAANYLFALLNSEFAPPLGAIGHLGARTLDMYAILLQAFAEQYHEHDGEHLGVAFLFDVYTHPSAVWFYGEVEVNLEGETHAFPDMPGNIITEIIIPDEVAFLRINSFMANPEFDDLTTLPFLQEIQDFNHLIIDIRGNGGGLSTYFNEFIFRRLIGEPAEIGGHEFFSGGEVAYAFMDATLRTIAEIGLTADWQDLVYIVTMSAEEFINQQDMQYFNQDDLKRLDYAMASRAVVFPADDTIDFGGKVWLLVDGNSASASALATEVALYTGFATVVGENTSGVMGSSHIYIVLPNTGIIWRIDIGYRTDAYGRSLEVYGLTPQIRNFDGMNALETVLALIEAGDY